VSETTMPDNIITERLLSWGMTRRNLQHFFLQRLPKFTMPTDPQAWLKQADEIRQRILRKVMYHGVPDDIVTAKPAVEWRDTIETGHGYSIRKFIYEGFPGIWFSALLYMPDGVTGKAPVMLNVNGHDYTFGMSSEAEQLRSINLAKRGIIVLHPEWICCGEMRTRALSHDKLAYLDLCGQSGAAVFYLHMKRALDILMNLPETDPSRVGMTGLSGGGWQTIILSSLDTRITHAIPVAGYVTHNIRAYHPSDAGDLEQAPCNMLTIADYDTLTALLAPRPTLIISNAYDDCCFASHRAKPNIYDPIRPLYELLGVGDAFEWYSNTDPGTHNYEQDNREALYRFINKHFLGNHNTNDEEILSQGEVLTMEQLHAGVPKNNANFASLASTLAAGLPLISDASDNERRNAIKKTLNLSEDIVTEATVLTECQLNDKAIRTLNLSLESGFAIPAVEYTQPGEAPVALVIADRGREASAIEVAELWNNGYRVLAFDPIFTGELAREEPLGYHEHTISYRFGIMLASAGIPAIGLQVSQIAAVARWVKVSKCKLVSIGMETGVAALLATALDDGNLIGDLTTDGMPESLRLLFEDEDSITKEVTPFFFHPTLFCFGLLETTDINDLTKLCKGKTLEQRNVWQQNRLES
jgi:hypothetical protein